MLNTGTRAGRPPVYALLLYTITMAGESAPFIGVVIQSVITSAVAYVGYRLVLGSTKNRNLSISCLLVLLLFPMNFMKSGTIDEAPLMIFFLLLSILLVSIAKKKDAGAWYYYLLGAGFMLGMAVMTRLTAWPVFLLFVIYIFLGRNIKQNKIKFTLLLSIGVFIVLSPWVVRNYIIYDVVTLVPGGGRTLIVIQSDEFIDNFPRISPDKIERSYFNNSYNGPKTVEIDDEFQRSKILKEYAVNMLMENPVQYLRSLIVKLKVLLPTGYFTSDYSNLRKDLAYAVPYIMALIVFFVGLLSIKQRNLEKEMVLLSIFGILAPGLIYFMTSRHMYPVIVLLFIYGFIGMGELFNKIYEKKACSNGVLYQ